MSLARARRGRTQASCLNTQYVRPLRGRSLANRHRKEKQIVSIVSIVVKTSAREEHKQGKDDFSIIHGGPQASLPSAAQPAVMDIRRRRRRFLEIDEHYKHAKILLCICESSIKKEKKNKQN